MHCLFVPSVMFLWFVLKSECSLSILEKGGFKLSIMSRRNQTGYWISQVQLEHNNDKTGKEVGPWLVDIGQTISTHDTFESVIITASVTGPPRRPTDYELVPGLGYYKFHTLAKTWKDARDVCSNEGGHLAIPNSETEVQALQFMWTSNPKILNAKNSNYAFVGFYDPSKKGEYITIFGDPLNSTGFSKWSDRQPSNVASENCGSLTPHSGYNDIACAVSLAFFCEQEL